VIDAFAQLPDWTLIAGGPVADGVDDRAIRVPGVVDDATRDLLLSAVDLVVLAFAPRFGNDSGSCSRSASSPGSPDLTLGVRRTAEGRSRR
jgi:hypothetical protein